MSDTFTPPTNNEVTINLVERDEQLLQYIEVNYEDQEVIVLFLSDEVNTSSSIMKSVTKNVTDDVNTTDTVTKTLVLMFQDNVEGVESSSKLVMKNLLDLVDVDDQLSKGVFKNYVESVVVNDDVALDFVVTLFLNDSVSSSDVLNNKKVVKVFTDDLDVSDDVDVVVAQVVEFLKRDLGLSVKDVSDLNVGGRYE